VTNWTEYDAALRARGSLTVWFTPKAARLTRGGQPTYSNLAIATALTLRTVFRMALRQTEGLIGSVLQLLGVHFVIDDDDETVPPEIFEAALSEGFFRPRAHRL
jgi:hypothetical protein